jgi:hypothetical protein
VEAYHGHFYLHKRINLGNTHSYLCTLPHGRPAPDSVIPHNGWTLLTRSKLYRRIIAHISNNSSCRLKHPGVPDGSVDSDGSDRTSSPPTQMYMRHVALTTGRVAYLPQLQWAWDTHHQNTTCVTLFPGAAVKL